MAAWRSSRILLRPTELERSHRFYIALWIQVRIVRAEHQRLVGAGVTILWEPPCVSG